MVYNCHCRALVPANAAGLGFYLQIQRRNPSPGLIEGLGGIVRCRLGSKTLDEESMPSVSPPIIRLDVMLPIVEIAFHAREKDNHG